MTTLPRPCLVCGRKIPAGSLCRSCRLARKRRRNADALACRDAVRLWVAEHGWRCPGWRRPPHPSTDLTADHRVPVSARGTASDGLGVLCRACNAAKGAR